MKIKKTKIHFHHPHPLPKSVKVIFCISIIVNILATVYIAESIF
ncbi:MAG: hypothetical protein PHG25_03955 [Candidatus Pacebacteria bacterium]|nr:hypothetical protein [Candidatus Paceibacterota bacterium]